MDVSIKSEVDSSSESECESDTDDEAMQVKEEPNEEEDITGRSEEQTDNASNSNDNREVCSFSLLLFHFIDLFPFYVD